MPSTRGPGQLAAAQHVSVQVENGLARAAAGVNDGAIATALRQSMFVGYARRNPQQVTKQSFVFLRRIIEGFHVFAGNDEQVRWRLRINVANDDATIVLINHVGRSAAR